MDVSQRLFRLMRSIAEDKFDTISRFIEDGSDLFDERLRSWEDKFDINEDGYSHQGRYGDQKSHSRPEDTTALSQVAEDLQLFGLVPPSNLEEVRQIRNQELKKFHPDKYIDQPEKLETAKQIVQIYNTAYDRLKKHFDNNG